MHLLHTRKLKLEEFIGKKVPRYAILSHRWGAEEITLQDIKTGEATRLLGYKKVKNACSVALKGGYQYIWIDTCCIDKTSSAELSEAINSMYRWYEEAEECYAYLEDLPPGTINYEAAEKFRESRWFTRGWTLQELIAPSTVIFLDSEWQAVGDKSSLQRIISEITGIPGGFLLGDDLGHASVAQRMSWASKRETTRIEDTAYCLMGIFGVYMPLLYGEGNRAFIRLQEEIMRVFDDHSLFAWRSTEDYGGILATSPSAFANSGNIIQINSPNAASRPLVLSSRGIRLSIPVKNNGQGSGLGILRCTEAGKESMRFAIHLRDVFLTNEDFVRERSSTLELLSLGKSDLNQYPLTDLHIRQWRSPRHRKWGNVEKCAIKFEGLEGQEVKSRNIYVHHNWELYDDGQIVTTMVLPFNGILGRLLVTCKDGNSFQVLLKKDRRFLLADIDESLKVDDQSHNVPDQQQHEQDQIVGIISDGQRVHVAIKRRILLLQEEKRLTGVVEISYSGIRMWLEHVAVLEGDIEEKTLLSYATRRGHEAVVKLLLDTKKADIDLNDKDWQMLLYSAVRGGLERTVTLFLDRNLVGTDSKDEDGQTPLSLAVGNGHEGIVKLLLEKGACVEAKDDDGWTPLMRAVTDGHKGIVQLFLENGAHIEVDSDSGRKLLMWAVIDGHEGIVKLLLENGAHVEAKDEDGWMLLLGAAADAQDDVVELLLSWAATNRRESIMKLLLEKGSDVEAKNNSGWTSLLRAAANGHETAVQLLLEMGAKLQSIDRYGQTPLALATRNGHEGVVELLLKAGAKLESRDKFGRTPLSWAAQNGHEAVVKQLLTADGVNPDSKDNDGWTPLAWAAKNGHEAVIKQLLATVGVNPDSKDNDGWTPLSWAAKNGHEAVVKQLLATDDVNPNSKDNDGWTPLSWIAKNKHETAVKQLLATDGVNLGSKDNDGWTPLSWIAKNKHETAVKQLLATDGVNLGSKDNDGRTPLSWAGTPRITTVGHRYHSLQRGEMHQR